jgi:hypothetical protein
MIRQIFLTQGHVLDGDDRIVVDLLNFVDQVEFHIKPQSRAPTAAAGTAGDRFYR